MSSKKFPPSNADQVLCKQNQLRHLQKQKEEWFRQRRAVEGLSDVAPNPPAAEREVACWSKSELKKKEQAELRELQQMADELRQQRDVVMGRQGSASKERQTSEEPHVQERDEELERAITSSLADSRLSTDQQRSLRQQELDLERQPKQVGTRALQHRSNTKAHFTKETTMVDDIDGMDEELEEMNDFLMAVDLQSQQELI
ncbi:hypothetical protein CYMTET_16266 [Cymbomonas tetramitiformis]|uniref:Uncharacterized protein n=1 Tax=Cymbomonas tetramitiformis TaxID=36881 RepID=A0AAE0L868_9CHLO|nr:hypothetical protein CYMTET_16266 [Cymbomonas tetramitiformis]